MSGKGQKRKSIGLQATISALLITSNANDEHNCDSRGANEVVELGRRFGAKKHPRRARQEFSGMARQVCSINHSTSHAAPHHPCRKSLRLTDLAIKLSAIHFLNDAC